MRSITFEAVQAFIHESKFNKSNTALWYSGNKVFMELFGNRIAWKTRGERRFTINNCGFFTTTTKERLNGLPNVHISQKNKVWFLNGKAWDGKPITIEY